MKWVTFFLLSVFCALSFSSDIDLNLIERVLEDSKDELEQATLEETILGFQTKLIPGHNRRGITKYSIEMQKRNDLVKLATKKLAKTLNVHELEAAHQLKSYMRQTGNFLSDLCVDTAVDCTAAEKFSKFRTVDGQCNNIRFRKWGATNIPFRRILSACKRDFFNTRSNILGIGREDMNSVEAEEEAVPADLVQQRQTTCPPVPSMAAGKCPLGNVLPNARLVSSKFHRDANLPAPRLTQLFTIFSQFVDHDITLSAAYNVPDCCTDSSDTEKCAPITVSNDPFYSAGKCLSFARSLVFCEELGCTTDPTNALSAYVDTSQVYGSDAASALALRSLSGGKLATSAGSLLPIIDGAFKGGDIRALENPALGSLQTVFLREHNRIATLIQKKFPLWSDEKIYQHTRRIVTAEYQNIAFGEMLPLILGTDRILPMNAMSTQYNPNMDASLLNEFSTAAYRFGHTLLNGNFNRNDPSNGSPLDSYLLRFNFNNDTLYKENADRGMTSILKGLAGQSAQSFDQFMTKEVTQFLFSKQSDNFLFGEDLASRNIQRGRDHSIQPWLSYRVFCGFPTPDDWNIRPQEISPEKWTTLQSLYLRVADIDLFTGGLAEVPVPGGTVGVTFACIIGEQFKRLLSGDRFFLTHSNNVGIQMLDHQVNAIRNVKLSDIICLTSSIRDIQRRVFEIPSPPLGPNPLVPCSNAFSLDMNRFYAECNCNDIGTKLVDCDYRCLNPANDPWSGLGCNAGGQGTACRFCGFDNYPPC